MSARKESGATEAATPARTGADRTRLYDAIGTLARLVLGVVLLVAGALKIPDPDAFAGNIMAYQLPGLEWGTAQILGLVMPLLEVVVGILLALGLFTRTNAVLGTLMMVVFIVLIASVWARGININCGCFGNGGANNEAAKEYPWEILRDLALALCGAWLVWRPRSLFSLDRRLFG